MTHVSGNGGTAGTGSPDPSRIPVLDCAGLTKSFGMRLAVDGVGFRIFEGEVYGLLGPNGAGKTTTMKMVCGLLEPDKGTISIAGRQAIGNLEVKALIGYVPQDVALYPDLTAGENLEFLARLYKLGRRTVAARVDEALELTELTDRRNDRLDSFSGGMKRRMNIAAGLLNHPRLLVLDEPTVGVDPQSRHAILERVQAFGREGLAVVYTTHYMEEAERVCDRVGIIDHGHPVAIGSVEDLRRGGPDRLWVDAPAAGEDWLRNVPGATVVQADGSRLLVELAPGGNDQAVLQAALRTGPVREFRLAEQSLGELFRSYIEENQQ